MFEKLLKAVESGTPAVLYTVIDSQGYPGLKEGSRLLAIAGGEVYGTLGISLLDEQVMARAANIFQRAVPNTGIIEINALGLDAGCELPVKILEDSFFPQKKLIIFGGGHVAVPLVQMASILGYQTVVVDDRPEFVSPGRFPNADALICSDLAKGLPENEIDASTSIVIITRGHQYDLACLETVIGSRACYIGMIGSSSKVRQTFKTLLNKGINKKDLEKVSAPIGLDLGGQKPAEIALSILAEMVAREYNGSCRPLKEVKAGVLE
ncbi:XdhC family protein [Desulfallas sp. Bu1-1]|uniref:XdhC family protein n=1 Tax=Desulfallas sp. Bu1-1 TaxID=2787620 RepID=UPI00189E6942|nr:XdhC/CoxI family protein [Desulfallas sp. Bu1-1]MBF7084458.1 XdhC family protein [Desulfallas sp. Bu1-1]